MSMNTKNKFLKIIWKIFKISIDKATGIDYNINIINNIEKHLNKIIKKDGVNQMKIEVQNNIPSIKVSVNQNADGSFAILFAEMKGKTLGNVKPGDTVTIGGIEYIVLGHGEDTTAIITKKPTKTMVFGNDGDYTKSNVRTYCNGEFYKELCKAVGKHNIVPHTVNLVSDDGSNKGATVKDNASILTCDLYRRYREFLPAIRTSCWTATRVTTLDKDYARYVCCVSSYGFLYWDVSGFSHGVRPFCILKSSVLLS